MVCLRNMCINTLHKGDNDDDNDNNDDNNNNNNTNSCTLKKLVIFCGLISPESGEGVPLTPN